jgi:hypothetical protein
MGFALPVLPFVPFLLGRFLLRQRACKPVPSVAASIHSASPARWNPACGRLDVPLHTVASRPAAPAQASARIRIVRILEAGSLPARPGGRMLISGRMADVCSALDRLAAAEALAE